MNIEAEKIMLFGMGTSCVLWVLGFMKLLRNDRRLFFLLLITLIVAFIGFQIRDKSTELERGNAADTFLSPLIYVISYWFLRRVYINIYKREPTYNYASWYDWEEGRRLNWLDVVVHVLPMILSLLTIIIPK